LLGEYGLPILIGAHILAAARHWLMRAPAER